jgi:hypothetical protein
VMTTLEALTPMLTVAPKIQRIDITKKHSKYR